jgi:hypothetical protein
VAGPLALKHSCGPTGVRRCGLPGRDPASAVPGNPSQQPRTPKHHEHKRYDPTGTTAPPGPGLTTRRLHNVYVAGEVSTQHSTAARRLDVPEGVSITSYTSPA